MNSFGRIDIKDIISKVCKYFLVALLVLANVVPFIWVILSSFKNNSEILARPFNLPINWVFSNYKSAWIKTNIGVAFMNSVLTTFISLIFVLIISAMVAYVLARVRPNLLVNTFFNIGIMIPAHATLIPLFIILKNFSLVNTRTGLIVVYIAGSLSLSIFILIGFMKTIPREIEESASIDGCPLYRVFFSIILPILKPALATVATLTFRNNWNDYLFASIINPSPNVSTMTKAVFSLRGQYTTDYGLLYAGITLAVVPVIIMYVIFQEQVIKGAVAGSVKG